MDSHEATEAKVSFAVRMAVSAVIPVWGIAVLLLGVARVSPWWIICGVVTAGVGLILAVGNPLVWPVVNEPQAGTTRR